MYGQAVDRHHPLGIHASHRVHFSCLGSSASRRPSPSRLNPSTARKIADPGKIDIQGAWIMKFLAVFSIEPHDGLGGCRRSEERSVGKECVSTCIVLCCPDH